MKANRFIAGAIMMMCVTFGCKKPEHFITDSTYRDQVSKDFDAKAELFADSSLFAVFDTEMTVPEREAMQFLYASLDRKSVV